MAVIDEHVEDALRELSDQDEQARLWLARGGPEISSLDECVSRLFDDSGLGDALDRGAVYSSDIDAALRDLRQTLGKISRDRPVTMLLADPDLAHARQSAQALLSRFNEDRYRQLR
jgi:hypothetical protein